MYQKRQINLKSFKRSLKDYVIAIKRLFNGHPLQSILYTNFNASNYLLQKGLTSTKVLYVTSRSAQDIMPEEFFLDYVDSLRLNFHRKHLAEKNFFWRFIYGSESNKLKKYESFLHYLAQKSFAVSQIDANDIGKNTKRCALPIKIDREMSIRGANIKNSIVFSGNFGYAPNKLAVDWFVEKCLSNVVSKNNEIILYLVGRGIEHVSSLKCHKHVELVGEVPNMHNELTKYDVAIAPMQTGSGMQFKILEAMAAQTPVITTSLGLGDIQAKIGEEVLVADKPDIFVQHILELIKNNKLRENVSRNGYEFVFKNHEAVTLANKYFTQVVFERKNS